MSEKGGQEQDGRAGAGAGWKSRSRMEGHKQDV